MIPRRAFTLIELLVVVAIVGILAVIAIPNLMQARVRGKVAKAKQELKTIAIAVEMYRSDQGDYPPNTHPDLNDPTLGLLRYNLTTPISYLASKNLKDPFVPAHIAAPTRRSGDLLYTYQNVWWYRHQYKEPYRPVDSAGLSWRLPDGVTLPEDFYGAWRACSYGPDQEYNEYPPNSWGMLDYDPTNGIVSQGNIWYGEKPGFITYHPGS